MVHTYRRVPDFAKLTREVDGSRKIFLEITVNNGGLRVDEPCVEVALEHYQHALYARVRLRTLKWFLKRK